jgi:hypothetical protein
MGIVVTYFSPATPGVSSWAEDLSGAVRLGTIAGLIDDAELGTVGVSSLLFDDPTGTLGHASDGLTGLKQLYIDETAAPTGNQRLWTGYIADRRYHRGTDSLITGVARKIDATLVDVNSFLSFRIFPPTAMDATSDFVRPAETDIVRVGALLTTVDFLSTTLFDDGLVSTGTGVAMDACDYTGQHPADVLNDCSQASGRNHWAGYNEATGHYQLFYDFDYSPVYDSALRISNVLADVDNVTTFAPEPDAELVRDPSRIVSAVYMPFTGGTAYRTRAANASNYAWRDGSAPSANVKTLAKANARADRYLLDSVPEDDRITCTIKIPREYVTGIKQGHRVPAKFSHLPNGSNSTWGSAFQWCRVLNRTVMANEQTNTLYNMKLELSPLRHPVTGIHQLVLVSGLNNGTVISANGTYTLIWNDIGGGTPPAPMNGIVQDTDGYSGTPGNLQHGPITSVTIPAGLGGTYRVGLEGMNTNDPWWLVSYTPPPYNPQAVPYVFAHAQVSCGQGVESGAQVVTYSICANGTPVASAVWSGSGGLTYATPLANIDATAVLHDGDVITATVTFSGTAWPLWNFASAYGNQVPGQNGGALILTFQHS